jgi:hypothetical protein
MIARLPPRGSRQPSRERAVARDYKARQGVDPTGEQTPVSGWRRLPVRGWRAGETSATDPSADSL